MRAQPGALGSLTHRQTRMQARLAQPLAKSRDHQSRGVRCHSSCSCVPLSMSLPVSVRYYALTNCTASSKRAAGKSV